MLISYKLTILILYVMKLKMALPLEHIILIFNQESWK